MQRSMRCVGRKQTEKRLVFLAALIDPIDCRLKKNIGAVALCLDELSVAANHWIKIGVACYVTAAAGKRLADAATAVNEDPLKAALTGLIGIFIAEVPLAENACCVAGPLAQHLRQRDRRQRQSLALVNRVRDARMKFMAARQQSRPGGRAGRASVKL